MSVRLHVNVDHVATLRQARGENYPDPVLAAKRCEQAGADGITVHLREDRRHIQDDDVRRLRSVVTTVLNLEMAATEEMVAFARDVRPNMVTFVPERREERTTEGGLDVCARRATLREYVAALTELDIPVSMFIAPESEQIDASREVGAKLVELHTGDYAHAFEDDAAREKRLDQLARAAGHATVKGLRVAAGHGLTIRNTSALVDAVPEIEELNIGHALVSDALFHGLAEAVAAYKKAIRIGLGL